MGCEKAAADHLTCGSFNNPLCFSIILFSEKQAIINGILPEKFVEQLALIKTII